MAKETAEQKLLKLIEATDSKEAAEKNQASNVSSGEAQKVLDSVRNVGIPTIPLPSFLSNLANFLKNPTSLLQPSSIHSLGIKDFNKIFFIVIVLVTLLFISDFTHGMKSSTGDFHFDMEDAITASGDNILPDFKDVSNYVERISKRNIFQPFERKVVKEAELVSDELKGMEKIAEKTKELKLVGISWLDTPESASAMIENTASGVTHFVKEGEAIQGVTVKNIFADSVILLYEGEEMEFPL